MLKVVELLNNGAEVVRGKNEDELENADTIPVEVSDVCGVDKVCTGTIEDEKVGLCSTGDCDTLDETVVDGVGGEVVFEKVGVEVELDDEAKDVKPLDSVAFPGRGGKVADVETLGLVVRLAKMLCVDEVTPSGVVFTEI